MPNTPLDRHPLIGTEQVFRADREPAADANTPPSDPSLVARSGDRVTVLQVYENWNGVAGLTMTYVYIPSTGYHTHFSPRELGLPGYGD